MNVDKNTYLRDLINEELNKYPSFQGIKLKKNNNINNNNIIPPSNNQKSNQIVERKSS